MHVVEESAEVLWDLVITDEMFRILTCVQLRHKVFACLINFHDCLWELQILLRRILESNYTEMLQLVSFSRLVSLSF